MLLSTLSLNLVGIPNQLNDPALRNVVTPYMTRAKNDVTDKQTHHKTGRTFPKIPGIPYSMNNLTVDKPAKNYIMTLVHIYVFFCKQYLHQSLIKL